MILDDNVYATQRERIERHKKNYMERSYNNGIEEQDKSNVFIFQAIICMFIFATLVIVKITNSQFTDKIILSINSFIEKDNLPELMTYAENLNNKLSFSTEQIKNESEKTGNTDITDNEPVDSDYNLENSNDTSIDNQNIQTKSTEFTIDENMLEDINKDSDILGKK